MDQAQAAQAVEALMQSIKGDANLAYGTRYLTLMGLVLVIYDHIVTFSAERRYIWPAPPSFRKYAFLVNRYSVPLCLFLSFLPLSGFIGLTFSDTACRGLVGLTGMFAVCSLALGNALIALRVATLWDFEKSKTYLLAATYVLAYVTCFISFLVAILQRYHYIVWNPLLSMCVLERSSPLLTVSWAVPLAFELLVLAMTCWNAVDRPREADMPLPRVLRKDGIIFFIVMTLLRATNLGVVATERPALVLLTSFFVWALATITLHRSLLAFRRAELAPPPLPVSPEPMPRPPSRFTPTPRPLSRAATPGPRRMGSESSAGCSSKPRSESWDAAAAWDAAAGEVELGTAEDGWARR